MIPIKELSAGKSEHWLNSLNGKFFETNFTYHPISLPRAIKDQLIYGVLLKLNSEALGYSKNSILVFEKKEDKKPRLGLLHFVGIRDQSPILGTLISKTLPKKLESFSKNNIPQRKSFMTPTPLHISSSKVSPIPSSSHSLTMVQPKDPKKGLITCPSDDILWLHPLIYVIQNNI